MLNKDKMMKSVRRGGLLKLTIAAEAGLIKIAKHNLPIALC
jgi:hypothetical protein